LLIRECGFVSFESFVYILLAAVVLVSIYIASTASVEPPLEWYGENLDKPGEPDQDHPDS
jgi:hypothetical protein